MEDALSPTCFGGIGPHHLVVPADVVSAAVRQPLLRGLMVTETGCLAGASGHRRQSPAGLRHTGLLYCVKGGGWGEVAGQLHPLCAGDLLVLPPQTACAYGAHASNPWTVHWVHATGGLLREYLGELGVSAAAPVARLGLDMQLGVLFNEILRSLERGISHRNLLQASHALAHLLAVAIRLRHEHRSETDDSLHKIAQCIIYMNDHLDEPLRVTDLASLAGLSPAHFTVRFKEQTGCAPKDYLQLLRIHRACQMLRSTDLSVKDIAARLGFQDPFHFSRTFKAFNGVAPTAYRDNFGNGR